MTELRAEFIQVITTIDSEQRARAIARIAVERRLAACVQVYGPIGSVYRWQGAIEEATEWACVFKALAAHWPSLERLIKEHHSYSVPEVLVVPVTAGADDYLSWLRENATPEATAGL